MLERGRMRTLPYRGVAAALIVALVCLTTTFAQNPPAPATNPAQQQAGAPARPQVPTAPPATPPVQAPPVEAAPETQSLHVLVGRSVVINLQSRLRRILISNPAVLE